MTWSTTRKSLDITDKRAHIPTWARASGRAPTGTSIDFSPLELFGAAARCNFLHAINPTVATPQSNAMAALIEMFVNDPGSDFAILASADDIKDFAKSYFSGTVAQGLAYLAMIREGYSWSDHFEALGGGNPAVTRKPDFVFGGHGAGVSDGIERLAQPKPDHLRHHRSRWLRPPGRPASGPPHRGHRRHARLLRRRPPQVYDQGGAPGPLHRRGVIGPTRRKR